MGVSVCLQVYLPYSFRDVDYIRHLKLWDTIGYGMCTRPDLLTFPSIPISRPILIPPTDTVKKSRFLDIPNAITKILPIFRFSLGEAVFVDIIRLFRDQQRLIVVNKNKIG